jgi:hypothetical protein
MGVAKAEAVIDLPEDVQQVVDLLGGVGRVSWMRKPASLRGTTG